MSNSTTLQWNLPYTKQPGFFDRKNKKKAPNLSVKCSFLCWRLAYSPQSQANLVGADTIRPRIGTVENVPYNQPRRAGACSRRIQSVAPRATPSFFILQYSSFTLHSQSKRPRRFRRGLALCWRLPIFPGRYQPSIVSASELNCRVRDGNGCTLTAISTNFGVNRA